MEGFKVKKNFLIVLIIPCLAVIFSCKEKSTETSIPFQGITETSSAGPDPIGNIDPDDWRPMMNCSSNPKIASLLLTDRARNDSVIRVDIPSCTKIYPAYPNPASKSFTIEFSLSGADSVVLTLNSTPSTVIKNLAQRRFVAGTYSYYVDGSDLAPAIYRLYITVYRQSDVLSSYGDIQIQ